MNIKAVGFAVLVLAMISGCASTTDIDSQEAVEDAETVQGEAVEDAETVQGTETAELMDEEAYDPNAVRCKRIAKTGSRFKVKVCATNAEWEANAAKAGDVTEQIQKRTREGPHNQ